MAITKGLKKILDTYKFNMKLLFLIPARAGSKGLVKKNVRLLNGKPLVQHTIDVARQLAEDKDICLSTNCGEVMQLAKSINLPLPFKRPETLSTDTSTTESVIVHAINHYKEKGITYDYVLLLQPTSPLRTSKNVAEAIEKISEKTEMIVSVKITDANPYYLMFNENSIGQLEPLFKETFTRRQDCPDVYELNGAIYIINVKLLISKGLKNLHKEKYVMSKRNSVDIDDEIDLHLADSILKLSINE